MVNSLTFALLIEISAFIIISLVLSLIFVRVLSRMAKQSRLTKNSARDMQEAILSILALLDAVWILQSIGLTSILSSLTVAGILGLGFTLALQSTLSNFFAGVWLLHDKVLRYGDIIKLGDITGEVVRLSFRSTWIKTKDGHVAVVSNSTLYNGPFINLTASERISKRLESRSQVGVLRSEGSPRDDMASKDRA